MTIKQSEISNFGAKCTCGSVLRLNVRNVKLRNHTVNLPEAIACN